MESKTYIFGGNFQGGENVLFFFKNSVLNVFKRNFLCIYVIVWWWAKVYFFLMAPLIYWNRVGGLLIGEGSVGGGGGGGEGVGD